MLFVAGIMRQQNSALCAPLACCDCAAEALVFAEANPEYCTHACSYYRLLQA
jgi:hypothetical protein